MPTVKLNTPIAEYLEMEEAATEKHEYYQGEIYAMSGAKVTHNRIASNTLIAYGKKLTGKPCKPYGSSQRISYRKKYPFYLS